MGPVVQDKMSFAGYWKDPFRFKTYVETTSFLPYLNNEIRDKNETFRKNIMSLRKLVLVASSNDEVIKPPRSAWFEHYDAGANQHNLITYKNEVFFVYINPLLTKHVLILTYVKLHTNGTPSLYRYERALSTKR